MPEPGEEVPSPPSKKTWEWEGASHPVEFKLTDWFEQWWPAAACPICKKDTWNASGPAYIPGYDPKLRHIFPIIPVACSTCGYTVLFNARIMGITAEEMVDWDRLQSERALASEHEEDVPPDTHGG